MGSAIPESKDNKSLQIYNKTNALVTNNLKESDFSSLKNCFFSCSQNENCYSISFNSGMFDLNSRSTDYFESSGDRVLFYVVKCKSRVFIQSLF